ncbi:LAMI_0F01200g1_1 [Lachancea mirantina]|uniref:LAMI_0F01200g1_1 n=1 Tax=Lachancea mirantina TaxID=1230905 RepID=A0A1G4JW56_9SACH|nr:LAMI_0F01200g1_1 [Lachancea mirantina]
MSTKYPSTMSCAEAFDRLTSCYSVGGQFRNYYRYGEFNPCFKQLDKFKFCIVNGTDAVKVQQWYRDEANFNAKNRGTSDDIWLERQVLNN